MATCTGPLLTPSTMTDAVMLPNVVGSDVRVTASEVTVALVIDPTAPSPKLTASLAAVGSKVKPVIVRELPR